MGWTIMIWYDLYTHDNYWISDEYHIRFTIHVGHCLIQLWKAPSPGSSFILWVPHLRGTKFSGPNRSLSGGSTHEKNMKSLSSCPVPRIPSDCWKNHIHYSYNFLHTHFGGSIFLFLVLSWPISDKSLSGVDGHLEAFPHLLHHATDSYEYRHAERIGIPHQSDHAHCKMHAIHGHSWPISLWISLDLWSF